MLRRLLALLPALACLLPVGCGGSGTEGRDRPVLVASNPAEGDVVPTGLSALRLTFDEPIRLFLSYQLQILRDGVLLPGLVFGLDVVPDSLGVVLTAGEAFSPGQYEVRVNEGLVLNADDQYALEPQVLRFQVAGAPAFFVGSPVTDRVTLIDDATLTPGTSTPTPGGRDPVGLLAQRQGAFTRVFVQLAQGGGTGQALAHYVPGSGFMNPVPLSTSGGDLLASFPALALSRDGASLYAAFRDDASGRVRLARVRTSDGAETGTLLLAVPAAPDALPTGLDLGPTDPQTLHVSARSGGLGFVSSIDLETFTELDRDALSAGTQPFALGGPAGPAAVSGDSLLVAPLTATTADLLSLSLADGTSTPWPALLAGTPTSLLVGYDGLLVLEGLEAAPNEELLALRSSADLAAVNPIDVIDDVGGVDRGATRVRALAQVPAQQRVYALLDASCLARLVWDGATLTQEDLDPLTLGMQVVPLGGDALGATCLGTIEGSLP